MKAVNLFLAGFLFFFYLSISTTFTSCTKEHTVHDTTFITVHDTTVINECPYDLKDGLIAYYSFNDGTLLDGSGYDNNIIFNNATKTTDRFGNPNNAYLFDGKSSYMRVKNSQSLNPDRITMYAIVNINGFYTGTCGGNDIISKGATYEVNGFYHLYFADFLTACGSAPPIETHELFSGGYGDNIPQGAQVGVKDATPLNKGKWYYIVYTYDGQTAKLYVNGELKSSLQKKVTFTANTQDLFIAKHENPPYPYYFNGVIDEIRIYNKALTADAIHYLVNLKN